MGADYFCDEYRGATAKKAFAEATDEARHDYGHAGYTGTIAEKTKFVVIPFDVGGQVTAEEYAEIITARGDFNDKWGPAGCIEMKSEGERKFLFFGYASS